MNLIAEGMGTFVQKTSVSRKLVIEGKARVYPVYRVRLDKLYYNDQNDRIATWISQYKSRFGERVFEQMDRGEYNDVIQQFVVESNPAAIDKTQINIQLVNQRESGVVLSDGRIIDGNRRFTCLRRLAQKDEKFNWFETVILDTSLESQRKQIKMLELAIQHGEEKKVDYNPLERLVGVYQDVVETRLLTQEEYAFSTNETLYEVKKRIALAKLLVEFLDFIHMPKQYHVARELQVVSALSDLQEMMKKIADPQQQEATKHAVFTNIMMKTQGDSRKYIRNLSAMMNNGFFTTYIDDQRKIGAQIRERFAQVQPADKHELDAFVRQNEEFADQLVLSMDKSLLKAKKQETRSRPSQIVTKSITLLNDIDTRVFEKLTDGEREKLRGQMQKLTQVVERYDAALPRDEEEPADKRVQEDLFAAPQTPRETRYYIARRRMNQPLPVCSHADYVLRTLSFTLSFTGFAAGAQNVRTEYEAFFIGDKGKKLSESVVFSLEAGETCRQRFMLTAEATSMREVCLAIRAQQDAPDELQQLIPFRVQTLFEADADF